MVLTGIEIRCGMIGFGVLHLIGWCLFGYDRWGILILWLESLMVGIIIMVWGTLYGWNNEFYNRYRGTNVVYHMVEEVILVLL